MTFQVFPAVFLRMQGFWGMTLSFGECFPMFWWHMVPLKR